MYKAIPIKALQIKGEKMERQTPSDGWKNSYTVDYLMSACFSSSSINILNATSFMIVSLSNMQ